MTLIIDLVFISMTCSSCVWLACLQFSLGCYTWGWKKRHVNTWCWIHVRHCGNKVGEKKMYAFLVVLWAQWWSCLALYGSLEEDQLLQEEATFTLDVAPWFCDTLRVPFPPDFFLWEILIQPILQSKEGARAVFVAAPKKWQSQMKFYISVSRHATEPSSLIKKGELTQKRDNKRRDF